MLSIRQVNLAGRLEFKGLPDLFDNVYDVGLVKGILERTTVMVGFASMVDIAVRGCMGRGATIGSFHNLAYPAAIFGRSTRSTLGAMICNIHVACMATALMCDNTNASGGGYDQRCPAINKDMFKHVNHVLPQS